MKNIILSTLAVALLCAGCTTELPTNILSPATLQQGTTVLVSNLVKPTDTNVVIYLRAADDVICSVANEPNIAPADITAAINASGATSLNSPVAQGVLDAVLFGYGVVWNSYGSNAVNSVPQLQPYLQAMCSGINAGLPPPVPLSLIQLHRQLKVATNTWSFVVSP